MAEKARAGRREPGASGRCRSQAADAVREAKLSHAKSREYDATKKAKTRSKRRSALAILAGLAGTTVLDSAAEKRIANADQAGLSAVDWRMWIQFQIELLIKGLVDGTLKADLAIQRAATVSREIRDYLDATGGQTAPVAVTVSTVIPEDMIEQLRGLGVDLEGPGDEMVVN